MNDFDVEKDKICQKFSEKPELNNKKERHGLVTFWLWFMIVANIINFSCFVLALCNVLPSDAFPFFYFSFVDIIFAIGWLNWKKWKFKWYIIANIIAIVLDLLRASIFNSNSVNIEMIGGLLLIFLFGKGFLVYGFLLFKKNGVEYWDYLK